MLYFLSLKKSSENICLAVWIKLPKETIMEKKNTAEVQKIAIVEFDFICFFYQK
jgi:hypothetical protein